MLTRKLITKDKQFEILIHGYEEPNNGRELWIASVHQPPKEGAAILENIRVNFKIDQWELENEEEEWIYIPKESQALLIQKVDQKIHPLPYWNLSTLQFLGNKFVFHYLLEHFKNGVRVTHLGLLQSKEIMLQEDHLLHQAKCSSPNTLILETIFQGKKKQSFHTISWLAG